MLKLYRDCGLSVEFEMMKYIMVWKFVGMGYM